MNQTDNRANQTADDDRARWARLAELIARADRRGLKALDPPELDEFARLYRRAVADLAAARAHERDDRVVSYLNGLVGRAAGLIYGGRTRRRLNPRQFFLATIPRTFRATWQYTAVAFAVFALPALVTYLLAATNPAWGDALFSPGLSALVEGFIEREVPPGQYFADIQSVIGADNLSGYIAVNNIRVALTAFALGITLGLGTLYILASTGFMVGAFVGVGAYHGRLADMIGIIAPHGFLELSAIFICGGGGLMMGWALIAPGDRPRGAALSEAARRAVVLLAGAVVMLAIAAAIEGYISPQARGLLQTNGPRLLFGFATWLLATVWLLLGDRRAGTAETERSPLPASEQSAALDRHVL